MAEGEGEGGGENLKDFATRKIGPFPVYVYAIIFVGAWYYLQRKKSAAATAASGTAAAGVGTAGVTPNWGTDPAGNTGYIDPQTGYVQGSAEDLAALNQQNTNSASGSYTTNDAWASAAINYLTALGEDPTVANSAIEAYLGSQTLTAAQQAMVNQAIQALGAPPQPPTATTTTPVVAPPGGATTYATNPPTGLTVASATSTSITLKWNAAANATGYTVTATPTPAAVVTTAPAKSATVTTPLATLSGLTPNITYYITVQATPADSGASLATTTARTVQSAIATPLPNPISAGPPPTGALASGTGGPYPGGGKA